jgi:hypothetical protein
LTEPSEGLSWEPAEEVPAEEFLFSGVITFVGPDLIRVHGDAESDSDDVAEGVLFKLTDETEITVAGETGSMEDLLVGSLVTITAERSGEEVIAKRIDVRPTPA